MFLDTFPEHLNANRFIDTSEEMHAPLDPQHYKRFSEMATLLPGGSAVVRGSRVPFGPREVTGEIECWATTTCQRCMEPVTILLKGVIKWGLIFSETEMHSLDKSLDPIMVDDGQLLLRQAIEDELVLLLPIMPMHEICDIGWTSGPNPGDVSEKESPFAVLAALKID